MFALKATLLTTILEVVLLAKFAIVFCLDYDDSNPDEHFFLASGVRETNDSQQYISILYSTHFDIFETQINGNFTQQTHTRAIRSQLSDPTEVYYSLHENYMIYEMIGFLYVYPLNVDQTNILGLSSEQPLSTSVKANSQLNIDWIHDLLFWVKDKKQIVVAEIRQLNKMVIIANKFYDYITTLAVNPIDSFVIWVEFDSDINGYIMFKSLEDGSNRHQFLQFITHVKRIEFDYQSQRIYYLSLFELISTTYEGADRRTVVREPHSIFEFEVLNDHIYWIEYNSNQLFVSHLSDSENSKKVMNFNHTINRFKIIDYWRQPLGLNRCLNANCSDICLPVDLTYYRCVCHRTCDDNQDIQLAFSDHHLISTPSTTSTTTTTQRSVTQSVSSNVNTTSDQILFDPIEQLDSLSFNQRNVTQLDDIISLNDLDYFHHFKSSGSESLMPASTHSSNTTPSAKSDDKYESKEEINKSHLGSDKTIGSENRDKHMTENTNRDSKALNIFANTSNPLPSEKTDNTSDIESRNVLVSELREYEYHLIPKALYQPLIYGLILLTSGLFIGTILSAIAIKIYGKHKW